MSESACLDLGQGQPRCSRWYEVGESRYLLASNPDCILQQWELTPGESAGLSVH